MRIIQLSVGNHSQNPFPKEQGKLKRRNQTIPSKSNLCQSAAASKRHRPDLCMNVLTTLGGGSQPDKHQPTNDAPSNTRKENAFPSERLSRQSPANASDVKESLFLEGATESVSSHAEDDLPQGSSQHHLHQSVPGEKDIPTSSNARVNHPLTAVHTSHAANQDSCTPKGERLTNEQTLGHRPAGTTATSFQKQSPAPASFRNLQASKQKPLQSRKTRHHKRSDISHQTNAALRNKNLSDQVSEPRHRASTRIHDNTLKGEQEKCSLANTCSSPSSDHFNTRLKKVDHSRIEAVLNQCNLQWQRHLDSLRSQHGSEALCDNRSHDTSSRTPHDDVRSPKNRKPASATPTSAPVNRKLSKDNYHPETSSKLPSNEGQRRVVISKSSFISTGVRLRIRPKKTFKTRRRRSLRLANGNTNRLQDAPIQVGGGNVLNGWVVDVADENPITIMDEETSTATSTSSARSRSSTSRIERSSSPLARRRSLRLAQQRRLSQHRGSPEVIQISDSDEEQAKPIKPKSSSTDKERCDLASVALAKLSLREERRSVKDLPPSPYLKPLTEEEEEVVARLFRRKNDEEVQAIPSANIVLRGVDFKRLRGERWLNDEIINAYASLVNVRNDAIFEQLTAKEREDIPNTYMFNTYFYTRLLSGPERYDYEGVRRWTTRARIDVTSKDLLLFPINLGNHHWVLAGIDTDRDMFFYLDSMVGGDTAGVLKALRRWFEDELKDKHGDTIFKKYNPERWSILHNRYIVRRVGVLPSQLEPRGAAKNRLSAVPEQRDGGSCGVFATKMADCLSLGIKFYFNQKDIKLVRQRMALDLIRGQLPM